MFEVLAAVGVWMRSNPPNSFFFLLFSSALFRCVRAAFALMYGSGLGVTMGAHRLWSHRAFKATVPLKIFLLWLHTLAGQVSVFRL